MEDDELEQQSDRLSEQQSTNTNLKQNGLQKRQYLKQHGPQNTRQYLTKSNIFKTSGVAGGLAILYYNRNRLTKVALKTYFKTDIKKYNTYKKNLDVKKKRLTFKQWYNMEHPQTTRTRKNYFNNALDKVESFNIV